MLTNRTIETLKPKRQRFEKSEAGGLRIRVYPSGRKAYLWRYRDPGGTQRVFTLGEWPHVRLTEARRRLAEAKALREGGTDPAEAAAEKRETRRDAFRAKRTAPTIGDILDEYMQWHVIPKRRPATQAEFRRLIETNIKPACGRAKAGEIKRTEIVAALDHIAETATPIIADHAAVILSAAFTYGAKRGRIEQNPTQGLPRYSDAYTKNTGRARVLTAPEIRKLWSALDNPKGVSEPVALALKLLLLTGQRRGSLALAEWSEFDADAWEIPAAHMKGKNPHIVPLSSLAQEIVGRLRELTGITQWVLPNPALTGPVTPRALTRAVGRLRGDSDYTAHDLRRTAGTLMTGAGVTQFVMGRVLAHAYTSETGTYDRYEYRAEKRRALETLARKVGEIIGRPEMAEVVAIR